VLFRESLCCSTNESLRKSVLQHKREALSVRNANRTHTVFANSSVSCISHRVIHGGALLKEWRKLDGPG
jgi:hypothetical protein